MPKLKEYLNITAKDLGLNKWKQELSKKENAWLPPQNLQLLFVKFEISSEFSPKYLSNWLIECLKQKCQVICEDGQQIQNICEEYLIKFNVYSYEC